MSKTMISARISEELGSRLEELAESSKRTKAFLLNEALEAYVAQRAWMVAEIAEAKREADNAGAFVSQQAMERWAESLATLNPQAPPEPDVFKRKNG